MGTDGLWEKLTNEEVVGLIGEFLDRNSEKLGRLGKSFSVLNRVYTPDGEGPVADSRVTRPESPRYNVMIPFR